MNKSLFGITEELLQIFENIEIDEETGELLNLEQLEEIQGEFDDKASNIALYIQELQAQAEAIKKKREALNDRQKSTTNKAERLKTYLSDMMNRAGKTKVETDNVRISFRKSESVDILDESLIPEEYINTKLTVTPDKVSIKKAIKSGQEILGAMLIENQNLQIK